MCSCLRPKSFTQILLYFFHAWPQDPVYGPLVDGMVVPKSLLGPLVRATAVNAGRLSREGFTAHYKQRAKYVPCFPLTVSTNEFFS